MKKLINISADERPRLSIENAFIDSLKFRGYDSFNIWHINELATKSNIEYEKVRNHKNGRKYLGSEDLLRLSTTLGLPVDYILKGVPNNLKKKDHNRIEIDDIKNIIKFK